MDQLHDLIQGRRGGVRTQSKDGHHLRCPPAFASKQVAIESADIGDFLRQSHALFTFAQGFLGALAVGDVGVDADGSQRPSLFVLQNSPPAVDPVHGTIGPNHAPLPRDPAGLDGFCEQILNVLSVLRVNQAEKFRQRLRARSRLQPEHFLGLR